MSKKIFKKILSALKKAAEWCLENWKLFLIAALAVLGITVYKKIKKILQIGEVDRIKRWEPVKDKTKVKVLNKAGQEEIVDLPVHEDGHQVTIDEVMAVGLPEKSQEGDRLNVKILHNHIDRTGNPN